MDRYQLKEGLILTHNPRTLIMVGMSSRNIKNWSHCIHSQKAEINEDMFTNTQLTVSIAYRPESFVQSHLPVIKMGFSISIRVLKILSQVCPEVHPQDNSRSCQGKNTFHQVSKLQRLLWKTMCPSYLSVFFIFYQSGRHLFPFSFLPFLFFILSSFVLEAY